jgi:hypothetical protein
MGEAFLVSGDYEMSQGNQGDLLRIKVDATGVDFAVSNQLAALVTRLLPRKTQYRDRIEGAFVDRIVSKLTADTALTDSERAFVEGCLSNQAMKEVRLALVAKRALEIAEQQTEFKLLSSNDAGAVPDRDETAADPESSEITDGDFLNKFREDAGLVDEEHIRDLYARILIRESKVPNSFSLSTLRVLRYLDRNAAEAFGRLHSLVLSSRCVPYQEEAKDLWNELRLDYVSMLSLEEYGLLNSNKSVQYIQSRPAFVECPAQKKGLSFTLPENQKEARYPVNVLTTAGSELARILPTSPDEKIFFRLGQWLKKELKATSAGWFNLPEASSGPQEVHVVPLPEE